MDMNQLKKALSMGFSTQINHDKKTRLASVLIIIYGSEPVIIMTEKPKSMNMHAGEISFPGGKLIDEDYDLLETALRETKEEIDLTVTREQVLGQLEPVITLNSGFTITPFVCYLDTIPQLTANSEVEDILHIQLFPFLKTMSDDPNPEHKSIQEMYTFTHQKKIIWGASARMLKQIKKQLSKNNII